MYSTLSFTPPSVHNGVKVAKLKPDLVAKEADRWKNALLGCVYGLEPRFKKIERFALNRWKDQGMLSVHMIKENLFLFLFDSEDSKLQVLEGGPVSFDRRPLIFKEWGERMEMKIDASFKTPIWINLPLFPWELWGVDSPSAIASKSFGHTSIY